MNWLEVMNWLEMNWRECIVALIAGGVGGAIVQYCLYARRSKREYAIELHREWWSKEFSERRKEIYAIVEDIRSGVPGSAAKEFLDHADNRKLSAHPAGRAFVQIVFFFADINACLEKGLLDKDLTYRLFGASQYFWFQPLIHAVRESIRHSSDDVRWKWETEELEEKFERFRKIDYRERRKRLGR